MLKTIYSHANIRFFTAEKGPYNIKATYTLSLPPSPNPAGQIHSHVDLEHGLRLLAPEHRHGRSHLHVGEHVPLPQAPQALVDQYLSVWPVDSW